MILHMFIAIFGAYHGIPYASLKQPIYLSIHPSIFLFKKKEGSDFRLQISWKLLGKGLCGSAVVVKSIEKGPANYNQKKISRKGLASWLSQSETASLSLSLDLDLYCLFLFFLSHILPARCINPQLMTPTKHWPEMPSLQPLRQNARATQQDGH